jgi:hypothetical protein
MAGIFRNHLYDLHSEREPLQINLNKIDPLHILVLFRKCWVPIEPPETLLPIGGLLDVEDKDVKIPLIDFKISGDLHTFNREEFITKIANELKIDRKLIVICSVTAGCGGEI